MKIVYMILFLISGWILSSCTGDLDAEELNQNNCGHQTALINCLPEPAVYNVRANGRNIGIIGIDASADGFIFHNYFKPVVLNKDGTIFPPTGSYTIYFKEIDCQGELYEYYDMTGDRFRSPGQKGRLISYQSDLYHYKPGQNTVYQLQTKSIYWSGRCINVQSITQLYYKLIPNDPAVTGIETYPFPTPIEIDAPQMNIITE